MILGMTVIIYCILLCTRDPDANYRKELRRLQCEYSYLSKKYAQAAVTLHKIKIITNRERYEKEYKKFSEEHAWYYDKLINCQNKITFIKNYLFFKQKSSGTKRILWEYRTNRFIFMSMPIVLLWSFSLSVCLGKP